VVKPLEPATERKSGSASAPGTATAASKNGSASAPGTATAASKTEGPAAPSGTAAKIYLLGLDGQPSWQRARKASGAEIVGCNDYLVPVAVEIAGGSPEARAAAAINKLLSLTEKDLSTFGYQSAFTPAMLKVSVTRGADGTLVIDLKGNLAVGGTCAVPRMKSQIEKTAAQFGRFVIRVNGSEAQWRCLGDESGKCT
jgi:hypothetical protein